MNTVWTQRYAQRTQCMQSSAIRELLKLTERPRIAFSTVHIEPTLPSGM
jgi:hypothetical protein